MMNVFFEQCKEQRSISSIKIHKISKCWRIIIYFIEWWNKNLFRKKCDALIEAIFSLLFENVQKRLSKDLLFQRLLLDVMNSLENKQHRRKWKKVIHRKINNAIFSSLFKKALRYKNQIKQHRASSIWYFDNIKIWN